MSKGKTRTRILAAILAIGLAVGVAALKGCERPGITPPPVHPPPTKDLAYRIHDFCGKCHAFPPADIFPRSDWEKEVDRMFAIYQNYGRPLNPPPSPEIIQWYQERAPDKLPPAHIVPAKHKMPFELRRTDYPRYDGPMSIKEPHISNVNLVHLFDSKRKNLDVLACEMMGGAVLVLQPYLDPPQWRVLYAKGKDQKFNPAHAEVVDLDGDKYPDILVANLGSFPPTDSRVGSVLWLRGKENEQFEPITLLRGIGRVADVQAADFNGDGKLDLIVACFGWNNVGEVYYLENQTKDWNKPSFVSHQLDDHHGAIHVPIADLNGDGKPDFVALFAQENEFIVAFLNKGDGTFDKQTLYKAPHPGYGSSGIQLVDLDKDGDLDILYTNGDTLDEPYLLKPYHGVQWLENKGNLHFEHHWLEPMYGVHRAVAADLDKDGDLDIVAVSFLPPDLFSQRETMKLDSMLVLEQTAPGVFARHSPEKVSCDHTTCAIGDVFNTGRLDVVTSYFGPLAQKNSVTIWRNYP